MYALRIKDSNAGVKNGICKYQMQRIFRYHCKNSYVTLNSGDRLFVCAFVRWLMYSITWRVWRKKSLNRRNEVLKYRYFKETHRRLRSPKYPSRMYKRLPQFLHFATLTLWPWKWTFEQQHILCVKCEYFTNQKKDNVMKYTTFCRGINWDCLASLKKI